MEYFTSLTGVFDDLARLKSDDTRYVSLLLTTLVTFKLIFETQTSVCPL